MAEEIKPAISSDKAAQQRLAARDAWRDNEQERQQRIIQETNQRQHVTPQEDEECRKMVIELQNYEPSGEQKRLTDWEVGFIETVGEFELLYSPKQADKIKATWHRIFGE